MTKCPRKIKLVSFILAITLSFNLTYISIYLIISQKQEDATHKIKSHNVISIDFDIMDIYRIDISCEYIIKDLASKISQQFANNAKNCSLSWPNYSQQTEQSRNMQKIYFEPIINETLVNSFDPFNSNQKNEDRPEFKDLEPGGFWQPKYLDNKSTPCNLKSIDYLIFLIPFSRSRIANLKLMLINLHKYLQNLNYPIK